MNGNKKKLLLVEDEALIALSGKQELEDRGYSAIVAYTGEEALETFRTNTDIDLVLMDIDLGPGMDGTETAQRMLDEREVPILFQSNHAESPIVEKTEKITSYGYVLKNSGITVLDASIKMAFRLFSARKDILESETLVKKKLQAILEPDGDIADLHLFDIIDQNALQAMMEDFHRIIPVGIAVGDFTGKDLVQVGWPDICTRYHRVHPETAANCRESDVVLSSGVASGEFKKYRCKNNLWDMVTPIVVGGRHLGNFCLGQFFYDDETPDPDVFRDQARRYGFNEAAYLKALDDVPRCTRGEIDGAMAFCTKLAGMISSLGYGTIKLSRALSQTDAALAGLAENEEYLQTILDTINEAIFVHDAESLAIISVNRRMCDLYGYTADEAKQLDVAQLSRGIPPYSQSEAVDWMRKAREEGPQRFEWIAKRKNGETFSVEVSIRTATIRKKECFVASVRDLTESKQIEQALNESQMLFKLLLESQPQNIYAKDNDGRFIFANQNYCRTQGMSQDQIVGKTDYDLHPKELADQYRSDDRRVIETGTHIELEEEHQAIGGKKFYVHVIKTPFCDSQGRTAGTLGIFWDITERKVAEEKIASLLEEKELILKEVHHRIKNNMNTISSVLSLQAAALTERAAVEALEDAECRIQSMMVLYDKLYQADNVTEISVGEYLPALIAEIVQNFPNGASVSMENNIDDFVLDVKKMQTIGILINELITNIMKYAFPEKEAGVITVTAERKEGRVTMSIADNGNGLSENINFEKSTGFGLMLVAGLVKQLKGTIRIERGNGTKIILEFEA